MAVSIHERFENHIDTASPETSGDAKRETDTEEDPYDKGFEEKLTLARIKGAEQQDSGIEKTKKMILLKNEESVHFHERQKIIR